MAPSCLRSQGGSCSAILRPNPDFMPKSITPSFRSRMTVLDAFSHAVCFGGHQSILHQEYGILRGFSRCHTLFWEVWQLKNSAVAPLLNSLLLPFLIRWECSLAAELLPVVLRFLCLTPGHNYILRILLPSAVADGIARLFTLFPLCVQHGPL